ncbi:unnamed protein product [Orchesella dallaii]|uniref:Odorant receptor n=1 Tax=Orchesella dallaii TaxID=48710 RepID=A0ABP1Q5A3_9HEXA
MSSNFIFAYTYVSYYLCFIPYRFKKGSNGVYEVHTRPTQKIICGVCHFLGMFLYATALRHATKGMSIGTAVTYFRLFENVFSFVYKLLIVKSIWIKRSTLLQVLNFPSQIHKPETVLNCIKIESTKFLKYFCTANATIALLRLINPTTFPLSQIPENIDSENGFFLGWYKSLVNESNYVFFQYSPYEHQFPPNLTYSSFEVVSAGITLFSLLCKFIMGTYVDLYMFMNILTLWSRVTRFTNLMRSTSLVIDALGSEEIEPTSKFGKWEIRKAEVEKVVVYYQSLQQLSKLINDAIGEALIPFIGEGIFTYAINLKDVLFLGTLSRGVVVCVFYSVFFMTLMASSSICRQVKNAWWVL